MEPSLLGTIRDTQTVCLKNTDILGPATIRINIEDTKEMWLTSISKYTQNRIKTKWMLRVKEDDVSEQTETYAMGQE